MDKIINFIKDFYKKQKEIIVPSATLLIICLVATILLGVTNFFTADLISEAEEAAKSAAMKEILPADAHPRFEGKDIYIAEKNGAVAGYIFVTSANGYGGEIQVMTALDPAGKIHAVSILSASDETPGLGQNVTTDDFCGRFKGLSDEIKVVKNGANAEKNEIKAATGATISSGAVTKAVNEALKLYDEHFGAKAVTPTSKQEVTANE